MPLVQEQYRQRSHKSYSGELQLKQDTSKQLFLDPKKVWAIKPGLEGDNLSSENESVETRDLNVSYKPMHPKVTDERRYERITQKGALQSSKRSSKNVRFQETNYGYPMEPYEDTENDYSEVHYDYMSRDLEERRRRSVRTDISRAAETTRRPLPTLREEETARHRIKNERFRLPHRIIEKRDVQEYNEPLPTQRYKEPHEPHETHEPLSVKNRPTGYEGKFNYMSNTVPETVRKYVEDPARERRTINPEEYQEQPVYTRTRRVPGEGFAFAKSMHTEPMEAHGIVDRQGYGGDAITTRTQDAFAKPYNTEIPLASYRYGDWCGHFEEGRARGDKKALPSPSLPLHRVLRTHKTHKQPYRNLQNLECGEHIEENPADIGYKKMPVAREAYRVGTYQRPYLEQEYHYPSEEAYDEVLPSKTKKTIMELPILSEQDEVTESTYKIPFPKFTNTSKKDLTSASKTKWVFCGDTGMKDEELTGTIETYISPHRVHKLRSRRTRMDKLKSRWKKAIVHTVREGTRNERVGLIVMGPKGPEFYSRANKKLGILPFRKTRSFLDGRTRSCEEHEEAKNVCVSSSEPGTRVCLGPDDLLSPEEDAKVEEKIEKYNKNVSDIVKSTEEKFLKSLSKQSCQNEEATNENNSISQKALEEKQSSDGQDVDKMMKMEFPPFHLLPFESLSPKVPKSFKGAEKDDESKDMKTVAQCLNEQAMQYRSNQPEEKDSRSRYSSPEKKRDTGEPSLWSLKSGDAKSEANGDRGETRKAIEMEEREKEEEKDKAKDEESQSGSAKSNEHLNINMQRRKKYYETTTAVTKSGGSYYDAGRESSSGKKRGVHEHEENSEIDADNVNEALEKAKKWSQSPKHRENTEEPYKGEETTRETLNNIFQDLVNNGSAISKKESENLQNYFNRVRYETELHADTSSSSASEELKKNRNEGSENCRPGAATFEEKEMLLREREEKLTKELMETQANLQKIDRRQGMKRRTGLHKETKSRSNWLEKHLPKRTEPQDLDCYHSHSVSRKVSKLKDFKDDLLCDSKVWKKLGKSQERKSKRKSLSSEEKMRFLREVLPSLAAENEAAHLKLLKKYIHHFIDRVEMKTSSSTDVRIKNGISKTVKNSSSTDSSEVKVDARKVIDIVSNPFKKIASDMTINIARTVTDALVQESNAKVHKNNSEYTDETKTHKVSEESDDVLSFAGETTSGSDHGTEGEPIYLRQLKKMRNDHLSNIVLEVRRLAELLRFLDRCNRLNI